LTDWFFTKGLIIAGKPAQGMQGTAASADRIAPRRTDFDLNSRRES
jgi:hypothetical protein